MSVLIVERIGERSVARIAIVSSLRGITLMISMMLISAQLLAQPRRKEHVVEHLTFYRTVQVDGLSIFYREAGPRSAPTILLLHGLLVQDAVAHNEGLGANWKPRRAFWADRAANESALRTNLLSLQTTRTRHVGNDPNVERYDPDLWTDESAFLSQPDQGDIQSDLFYDYRTNVDAYPKWQAWMREKQPRLLVIWGQYDLSFDLL